MESFAFKPQHLEISSHECTQVTQLFIIMLNLKAIVCFPMKNAITMNSDCNDSPSKLAMYLFLQETCFQQQKHVCALSSGHPLLKWSRPHISLSNEKGFDHCCQAESTQVWKYIARNARDLCRVSLLVISLSGLCKWRHFYIPAMSGIHSGCVVMQCKHPEQKCFVSLN